MNAPHISRSIPRRRFLRGAGVLLALPGLAESKPARRMLIIANNLGVLARHFFPKSAGPGYEMTPYLSALSDFRDDFTVFSGLSHPGVTGGHSTDNCFLTTARGAFKSGFRNTISLDQFAAEKLGPVTRFPVLTLGVNVDKANRSLSFTRDGVLLPAEDSAPKLFEKMFVRGDEESVKRQLHRLDERGSILDTLLDDARRYGSKLGADDRSRLDQYFTSVREVEERLRSAREWEKKPKPEARQEAPPDIQEKRLFFEKFDLMLTMAQLAFESDSTRVVTVMVDAFLTPVFRLHEDRNSTDSYHGLSHHGQSETKVKQLEAADHRQMALLKKLLGELASKRDGGHRLLDLTMVMYGSNMGDANIHDNTNLPVLLAGGGFRHGQHIAFRRDNNAPLANLFVSMLQRLGIETDSFGSSTGRLSGLEMA